MTIPIIEKLGGYIAAYEALKPHLPRAIGADAVRMWKQRGSIPGYGMIALAAAAKKKGIEFDPGDYTPPQGGV